MNIGWRFKFTVDGVEKTRTFYEENYSLAYDKLKEEFADFTLIECYRSDPERWLPIGIGEPVPQSEKQLFKANESWTEMANEIDHAAHRSIMSILRAYSAKGYKVREIAHVIHGTVLSAECEVMLSRRAERHGPR